VETCAPAARGQDSPWATYVEFLARRYHGVSFEVWNEPNLRNGFNDTPASLAEMQQTARAVIRRVSPGTRVVSPSVAVTAGDPLGWLRSFLAAPGGRDFDVFGIHLYPLDAAARGGTGPEWSMGMLGQVEQVLGTFGIRAPIWDTEVNVGRYQFRNTTSRVFSGLDGAAVLARTYALQLGEGVQRLYWYAADDRSWSGTWLVNDDGATLTPAGTALNTLRRMLLRATPHGCSGGDAQPWTCRFTLASGRSMLITWTTGSPQVEPLPKGVTRVIDVVGTGRSGSPASLRVTSVPQYVVGTFGFTS
jgi:hypothetical protein